MSVARSPLNVRIAAVLAVLGLVLHAGLSLLPHATAAGPDGELVEICTSGGVRLVAVGTDGRPAGPDEGPVVVDCPVCLAKTLVLVAAFAAAGLLLISGPGGGGAARRPDDPQTGGGADERPPARAPPAAA
jgi:hypothetical protein